MGNLFAYAVWIFTLALVGIGAYLTYTTGSYLWLLLCLPFFALLVFSIIVLRYAMKTMYSFGAVDWTNEEEVKKLEEEMLSKFKK